jgi:hypothetical protein
MEVKRPLGVFLLIEKECALEKIAGSEKEFLELIMNFEKRLSSDYRLVNDMAGYRR